MKKRTLPYSIILFVFIFGLEGCMVWPFMTETVGYRPLEMGKRDQVFYPEAPRPSKLSKDFGDSQRAAIDNQILNPEASKNLESVEGLDRTAGTKAMNRYQKFFDKPPYTVRTNRHGGSKQ